MNNIEKNFQKHNCDLSEFATKDEDAIRLQPGKEEIRPPFFRDADKILYSLSYFRYIDKTQVFSLEDNDMISKRMTHVQLVSKIARTIGRGLNLNEDLIEAASLGHDLGHVPFGHVGEKILNKISLDNNEGYFYHNVQSVRTLMNIENYGNGSNVTIQTLDAILCHNGEKLEPKYVPKKKAKEDVLKEYEACYNDKAVADNLRSMTLEGCVVRVSDVIAYIGRDIEDAIRLKKINADDIPKSITSVIGSNNSEMINAIVLDIIENSFGKNYITMSKRIYNTLQALIDFNYKNVYLKANTKSRIGKIEKMFNDLFDLYYSQIKEEKVDSDIFVLFLNSMSEKYKIETSPVRKVLDYISGMTDSFFINQYNKNFKYIL